MRTAHTIKIAYTAADMLGKADDLHLYESDGLLEVEKDDPTGDNSSEWAIYVRTNARRQVARVYIARTGEEWAISADEAEYYIMGIKSPVRP